MLCRQIFQIIFKQQSLIMKQQSAFAWQADKYYRCRPSLYQSMVISSQLVDIDGTRLFFYNIEGMVFDRSVQVLQKDEQFCAKIRAFNDKYLAVFGLYRVISVSVNDKKVVDDVEIPAMIQKVQAANGYAAVLTSDEEGEGKLIYCWKINENGKFEKAFEPVEVHIPQYQQCSDELLQLAIILSVDNHPKIYLYWRNSSQMLEVDPIRKLQERYNRTKSLSYVTDIDAETYSEICGTKIIICNKKGGKEFGSFSNEQENFKKVIGHLGQTKNYYSISNQGVKKWKLEPNSVPILYADSQNYPVQSLFLTKDNSLVGISLEKRWVVVWKNQKQVIIHNFPNEVVRKLFKISDSQACLMLEATINKIVQNQCQVQKHNKMEIYDFSLDREVAKKAVLKLEYRIDVQSSIAAPDNSILFILNEDTETQMKKHIFRWWPFAEDKKKQIKKREIVGGSKFDSIKLYPFDRILTFKRAQTQEMYDFFGKLSQGKSVATLFDFSAKKIGQYELGGEIIQVQLSNRNQLFALGKDKFSIYQINTNSKNRLQKVHELQVSVSFVYSLGDYLLMKKENSFLIYDKEFDLVMKQDEDEDASSYRILKISEEKFIIASDKDVTLWDLGKEDKSRLKLEGISPSLVEQMGGRLVVADKWIKSYDFQSLKQ